MACREPHTGYVGAPAVCREPGNGMPKPQRLAREPLSAACACVKGLDVSGRAPLPKRAPACLIVVAGSAQLFEHHERRRNRTALVARVQAAAHAGAPASTRFV